MSQHANELSVAEILAKTDKIEAKKLLLKLRNLGNHKHNCEVLNNGSGSLVVIYRPSTNDAAAESYAPCPNCFGYYQIIGM